MLVHCEGGIGRTGTMAAAYWIARGLTVADAIARIRKARRGAVESEDQKRVLHRFAEVRASPRPEAARNDDS
jgi:protein-tyrosine phosphatase